MDWLNIKQLVAARDNKKKIKFHKDSIEIRFKPHEIYEIAEIVFNFKYNAYEINLIVGSYMVDEAGLGYASNTPMFCLAEEVEPIAANPGDTCKKCGTPGHVKGLSCICPKCHNIIWGI
jgi:hypothetical protein